MFIFFVYMGARCKNAAVCFTRQHRATRGCTCSRQIYFFINSHHHRQAFISWWDQETHTEQVNLKFVAIAGFYCKRSTAKTFLQYIIQVQTQEK